MAPRLINYAEHIFSNLALEMHFRKENLKQMHAYQLVNNIKNILMYV